MNEFTDTMTLKEARNLVLTLVEDGLECPCCRQYAKVYRRPLHAAMAAALIRFYKTNGTKWATWPTRQSDEAKLRYWNLMEEQPAKRGTPRLWRVTELGEVWILRGLTVRSHALVYDSRLLALTGERVTILDALGKKFSYEELMYG